MTVESEGSLPDPDASLLEADGTSYAPTSVRALWDDEDGYTSPPDDLLIFSVPNPLDATEASFRWKDGKYSIGKSALRTLNRPPTDFSVDVSAPESVTNGREATLRLTVENIGDAAGTFVGALNRVGPLVAYIPVTGVSLDIGAGESKTWTYSYAPNVHSATDDSSATFHLNWRGGRQSATIDVDSA